MTSFATKIIVACAISTGSAAVFANQTVKATVNGMVCAFCAQGIEKRLSKMPATKAVFVDLKQRVVAVEAKEGQKLDDKLIRAEITDAGYDVVKLEPSVKSVADLRAELKAKKQ